MRIGAYSLRQRLGLLVAVAAAGMVLLAGTCAWQLRAKVLDGRRRELVAVVQAAYSIVEGYQRQAAAGQMPTAQAQEAARQALLAARYGDEGKDYLYAYTTDGVNVVMPVKPEWQGQQMIGKVIDASGTDVIAAITQAAKDNPSGAFVQVLFPHPGGTVPAPKLQYVRVVPGWNWMIGSGLYMDEAQAQALAALVASAGVSLAALVALATIGWAISRGVLRQIGGEPVSARRLMREVARGNLAIPATGAAPGSLLADLDDTIHALRTTVDQVRHAAAGIATASSEIASGGMDLSSRTERVASSLQETAATVEQLSGTVAATSDSSRRANELAARASETADAGSAVMRNVAETMARINDSASRIADIIGVIDGIAFQTNILALNAAVEAARAGDQGRGFAVVASEVRTLARRSAQAAREIKGLIAESVERVGAGTALVSSAGESMGDIVGSVARVRAIIDEIAAATREQSNGIEQVNRAVADIDRATQENAALVEEASAATASLKEQAASLDRSIGVFSV